MQLTKMSNFRIVLILQYVVMSVWEHSQAPDVDLRSVRLRAVEQFGRGVFRRPAVRLERLVLLVHVAQTEIYKPA